MVPTRHPDRWRYDAAGNLVMKALRGCMGQFCHEYDHITPYSKGGETIVRNCQVLQTNANRLKSNRTDITEEHLRKFSIKKQYPGINFDNFLEEHLDLLEEFIYGNVKKIN